MDILIMIGQLVLSLSILIILHEMGHFIPARLFGTRVEKFYLFFDAGFSLFKKKIGETEYGIGWLPLGGYVKIAGMIDESFDKEQMAQPPQPWEFRTKPAWQRLIIMLGGVTVNFILGFFIYGMVLWVWGEEYLPADKVTEGIYVDSLGMELGLQDGDKIISIGDTPFDQFNDRQLIHAISIENADHIKVNRNNEVIDLPVSDEWANKLISHDNKDKAIFGPRMLFIADSIITDSPADKAGMLKNDRIISLNDQSVPYFHEFAKAVGGLKETPVKVGVIRNQTDTLSFNMTTTKNGTIGVAPIGFEFERIDYTFGASIPAGFTKGISFLTTQLKAFGQMFRGNIDASESLGGFASIGKMFGAQWNWERFWLMTAILSLILAFMNLLPIPALDGGYVMFLIFEVVTGIKPSDKVIEVANTIGFVLVLGLLLYANGLDIVRAWF
ncbi:MAG: RIP metalloprotease RseP [Saprospiraceae bacterium]|nr:RIP metalloprotease RseP [Saprospiraceae bacterium]MCB9322405.1 RIP metalloprotease RseP [Lewinellaceae bacterium]